MAGARAENSQHSQNSLDNAEDWESDDVEDCHYFKDGRDAWVILEDAGAEGRHCPVVLQCNKLNLK